MPPNPHKQQCTAATQTGGRCRQWALKDGDTLHGRPLCSTHAGRRGHRLPNDQEAAAGRRCTAATLSGQGCRRWAVSGRPGQSPLCYTHLSLAEQPWPGQSDEQRCTATAAATGQRCRKWALPDSPAQYGRPLCHAHAGRVPRTRRMPGRGERRCTALTRQGRRCRQWATRETAESQARDALCVIHAAHQGGLGQHVPRRCTATVNDGAGRRCRNWALNAEGATLCWTHAHPDRHGRIRHGFYRDRSPLQPEEQAAVARVWSNGQELQAAILLARFQVRALLAYLAASERPLAQELNTIQLLLRGCRRVRRLVMAARQHASTSETGRVPIAKSEAAWLHNTFLEIDTEDANET